jgi:hypothetical protein
MPLTNDTKLHVKRPFAVEQELFPKMGQEKGKFPFSLLKCGHVCESSCHEEAFIKQDPSKQKAMHFGHTYQYIDGSTVASLVVRLEQAFYQVS